MGHMDSLTGEGFLEEVAIMFHMCLKGEKDRV